MTLKTMLGSWRSYWLKLTNNVSRMDCMRLMWRNIMMRNKVLDQSCLTRIRTISQRRKSYSWKSKMSWDYWPRIMCIVTPLGILIRCWWLEIREKWPNCQKQRKSHVQTKRHQGRIRRKGHILRSFMTVMGPDRKRISLIVHKVLLR